jgi:hypothetical protein
MAKCGLMLLACAGVLVLHAEAAAAIKHVFVIAMENHDATCIGHTDKCHDRQIYGNANAPYINDTLIPTYAHATNFKDELPLQVDSEPHYIWMEAGTNAFSDGTFLTDRDPSGSNSTSSTDHLATQIRNSHGDSWMSYQEGLDPLTTGACPVRSAGRYAAKHDPFVFFQDVAGDPPSKKTQYCADHHKPYSSLAGDLAADRVASFVFITPDICHDMHGAHGCGPGSDVSRGDDWLKAELPRLMAWANKHSGVIFLTFDEGRATGKMPFIAIGPGVKTNYAGGIAYDHGSMLKSIEKILGLPVLKAVEGKNDLADLFELGAFP